MKRPFSTPSDVLASGAAWLTPEGEWHACAPRQHDRWAHEAGTADPDGAGWVRLCGCGPRLATQYSKPTNAQLLAMAELVRCDPRDRLARYVKRWMRNRHARRRRVRG